MAVHFHLTVLLLFNAVSHERRNPQHSGCVGLPSPSQKLFEHCGYRGEQLRPVEGSKTRGRFERENGLYNLLLELLSCKVRAVHSNSGRS